MSRCLSEQIRTKYSRISRFGSIASIWKTWKKNTKWLVILLPNFWYIHSLDPDDLTKLAPTGNEICVDTFSALNRSGIVPRPDEFSELTEIDINKHVLKFSIGYGESRHTKNRWKIIFYAKLYVPSAYYKHLKKAAQHSHLGRMGWFCVE